MYDRVDPEKLILRDLLALDRTHLANERTLLSYLRTGLMMLVTAATLLKLFPDNPALLISAYLLLPLGLVIAVAGLWRFLAMRRRIRAAAQQAD